MRSHVSEMEPCPMQKFQEEVNEKVKRGKSHLVAWKNIKNNPPKRLKESPIVMISHKSRGWRAILDLAYSL